MKTSTCDSSSDDIPDHFLCPISLEIMDIPVRDRRTGQVFERRTILEWIYFGNATCPMTRLPISTENLRRAFDLQREIGGWKKQNQKTSSSDSCPVSVDIEDDETLNSKMSEHAEFLENQERMTRVMNIRNRVLQKRQQDIQAMMVRACQ